MTKQKKALLVVSFGSSIPQAREKIEKAEGIIGRSYEDRDLYVAYTSHMIKRKLEKAGIPFPSPLEVIEQLVHLDYQDLLVVPTHVIPGHEFDSLKVVVDAFKDRFDKLELHGPLLQDPEAMCRVCRVVGDLYPKEDGQMVLLMGHGSDHSAGFIYPAMTTAFHLMGREDVFVGTVEGWPSLEDAILQIRQSGVRKVFMAPLLFVAGDHVINDMTGPEEDSWKNRLICEGLDVDYSMQGLCEFEQFLGLY